MNEKTIIKRELGKKISFGNIYVENVFEFFSSIAVHES